jgi:hypothetical protein
VLYNALSAYGWSSLYNEIPVDTAVEIFNVIVTQAIDLSLPPGHIKKNINIPLGFLAN